MAGLKDNLIIKEEELELSLAQTRFSLASFFNGFQRGKKIMLLILVIGIIPVLVAVRLGARLITERQLAGAMVEAHPSYTAALAPSASAVTLINSGRGWYSVYVQVANDNLDLAASSIPYQLDFYNAAGENVVGSAGAIYLLPNQKKYIIVSRLDTREQLTRGELTFGEFEWQKRLSIPEVPLRAAAPFISNEVNPLTLVADGAVVNDSPYELAAVRLVFLLYDKNNRIVAVSQRDEFNIPAFGRRAYKQTWPDLYQTDIARATVLPDTNTIDSNNLIFSSAAQ